MGAYPCKHVRGSPSGIGYLGYEGMIQWLARTETLRAIQLQDLLYNFIKIPRARAASSANEVVFVHTLLRLCLNNHGASCLEDNRQHVRAICSRHCKPSIKDLFHSLS